MDKQTLFDIWAPPGTPWTPWAKAVVFSQYVSTDESLATPIPEPNLDWLVDSAGLAVIADLPGPLSVSCGLALARRGFRPVPLYNAIAEPRFSDSNIAKIELVDVRSIRRALAATASQLADLHLPYEAPPAFLLDAQRRYGTRPPQPGDFDNRSICFPTDFPSASMLAADGIRSVLLIQQEQEQPQADLSHILLRWQQGGITIQSRPLASISLPISIKVVRPSAFRAFWYTFWARLGLKRSPLGGFGGFLFEASAG